MDLTPAQKARLTAKWATTMTRWHIGFVINGKRLGSAKVKPIRRWQLVGFPGPGGQESAGIVDLLAIRKNHKAWAVGPGTTILSILDFDAKGDQDARC